MRLGDFVTLQRGHDLPDSERRPGPIPILGSFGITGYHDAAKAKGPGVTVGRSGASFGVVAYSPVDFWPLNTALYVIDFHGNCERFVYYFLKNFDFSSFNSGSAQPSLNRNYIHPLPICTPSGCEQRAIAGILGALDDKIDLNRRTNETLESIARAIFKSWFVDFDPVRAKAEGRQPAGTDAETAALFPAHFEASDAGPIPSNWTNATITDVAGINDWTLSERDEFPRLEYIEISGVMKGDILETTWYDRPAAPSRARRRLRHGDTVLSTVRPDRGAYFLALHPHEQMIASTGFAVITPRSVPWSFLYCVATRKELFEHLGVQADGGAYPAVSPEIIGKWDLCLPANRLILSRFHSVCAPLLEQAEANRRMSQTLAELRDALLPKLLSGELRIRDAERMAEAHV